MTKFILGLFFLLTSLAWGQWTPTGYKQWRDFSYVSESPRDTALWCKRIGGEIANYQDSKTKGWRRIENDWITVDDSIHTNRRDLLKTDVMDNGQSVISLDYEGETYTVVSRLTGIGWLNINTSEWTLLYERVDCCRPTVEKNLIHWTDVFPGVDYEVEKCNARIPHRIIFKKEFLDDMVHQQRSRGDSLDLQLAIRLAYEFSPNIDDTIGNMDERILKKFRDHIFLMARQMVHFPGCDTVPERGRRGGGLKGGGGPSQFYREAVGQRWEKIFPRGDIYCMEYVDVQGLKAIHEAYPDSAVWHNDETKVISGTTNVEDAYMDQYGVKADYNYGGADDVEARVIYLNGLIRVKNVASELGGGATITGCVDSMYCNTNYGDGNTSAYRVFKPWIEGTKSGVDPGAEPSCTWNDWSSDTYEWTTAGCNSADDDGSDNSGDGTGADRKATAEDTENVTTVNTWYAWSISSDLAQGWYDETINEEGIVLIGVEDAYNLFSSTEDNSNQPFWTFTYTTGGAPPETHRRRRIILGDQ